MVPTTEMRWWWRGAPPPDTVAWVAALPGVVEEEARTDHYLVPASDPGIGIKARAGDRLEVKACTGRESGVAVGGLGAGTLERWRKWSFPLAEDGPGFEDPGAAEDGWARTSKYRWLVPAEGCELELAAVEVASQRWWSLAAEADGEDDAGRSRLLAGLSWLEGTGPPEGLRLTEERSHGYAELLVRLRDEHA